MYKFETNGPWGEFLVIESKNMVQAVQYIKDKKIKNIWISKYHGYKLKNISFITDIANLIEGLIIIDGDIDLKGIEELKNLKMLSICDEKNYKVDLSIFKNLERVSLLWSRNISNLSECKKIVDLNLRKVSDPSFLSDIFNGLKKIQELVLIECKINDLKFFSNVSSLKNLDLSYCSSLKDISQIHNCKNLTKLIIENCKKIESYDSIKKLDKLTFLTIGNSADIQSLQFLKGLNKLKHFGFVGTNILDGDLSPCVGIEHVGFNNKRHYSHTYEEINKKN